MSVIDKLTYLSLETGLDEAAATWLRLRRATESGRITDHEAKANGHALSRPLIQAGEGVFWLESTQRPGELYLFRPVRALSALEQLTVRVQTPKAMFA